MDEVDVPLTKLMIEMTGTKLGWDRQVINNLIKAVCTTNFKVISYYMGTRKPLLKATTHGGVLSGIST